MIENFLSWVAEKRWANGVCVSVCSRILAPGARTAWLILTGEAPFDAPERRKDDIDNRRAIGRTWYAPRANVPCKKRHFVKTACKTSGGIRLKLYGPMATLGVQNPFAEAMVAHTWQVPQARVT